MFFKGRLFTPYISHHEPDLHNLDSSMSIASFGLRIVGLSLLPLLMDISYFCVQLPLIFSRNCSLTRKSYKRFASTLKRLLVSRQPPSNKFGIKYKVYQSKSLSHSLEWVTESISNATYSALQLIVDRFHSFYFLSLHLNEFFWPLFH